MWFIVGAGVVHVYVCGMGQVCVVKCCGSVERGMVHRWFSIGSVAVHVYV